MFSKFTLVIQILDSDPQISYQQATIPGPFITPAEFDLNEPTISETCGIFPNTNSILFVKCPPMKCGIPNEYAFKSKSAMNSDQLESTDQTIKNLSKMKRSSKASDRVVGGIPCHPMKWPFIIGMYRDGNFHCGGIIHNDLWVIINEKKYLFM